MKTMRLFAILFTAILFIPMVNGQSQDSKPLAFGGLSFQNTLLKNKWAAEVGGFGAAYVSQSIYVGGAGFGASRTIEEIDYSVGYGGLMAGYQNLKNNSSFNFNLQMLAGYGVATVEPTDGPKIEDDFWVIKPGAEITYQVSPLINIGIGGGYRFALGSDLTKFSNHDLSAPFAGITVRFGNFSQ